MLRSHWSVACFFREKKEEEEEWDEDEEKEDEDAGVECLFFKSFSAPFSSIFKKWNADLLSRVQNEEDDWQENEELRAIEGLEGEHGGRHALRGQTSDMLTEDVNCLL